MPQLNFAENFPSSMNSHYLSISDGTLSFVGFNILNSISFLTLNLPVIKGSQSLSYTFYGGLYSLTGSTLSLTNSISVAFSSTTHAANRAFYVTLTATSATQNITPGTWYWGLLARTDGNTNVGFIAQTNINAGNAFPGGFIGGRMTDSTSALPASYATSNLDITGNDATNVPVILLTA